MTTIAAHFVDKHVGARIRSRRRELAVSQAQLANATGCTFQQIQKYEDAKNRVSASRLFAMAQALAVNPSYFFFGLTAAGGEENGPFPAGDGPHNEGAEAALLLARVTSSARRQRILELVRAIAAVDDAD